MLRFESIKYPLQFKVPSGTSRGVLEQKPSYFIKAWDDTNPEIIGLGECSIIPGLSIDATEIVELELQKIVSQPDIVNEAYISQLLQLPALRFGMETALLDLKNNGNKMLFKTPFTQGLMGQKINGLIWMQTKEHMLGQIKEKIELGFSCLKLKIGAIAFDDEVALLKAIRNEYKAHDLEIRVDANGAFPLAEALSKLQTLDAFDIHSIEQPIQAGNWDAMAQLCQKSPVDIALDEELIGITDLETQQQLLETIQPHYCIFKPSLLGGFEATNQWIKRCGEQSIPWWMTSALESNIGLNAIAQYSSVFYNPLPQGLGTGQLYTNNITSPLEIKGDYLHYNSALEWELPF